MMQYINKNKINKSWQRTDLFEDVGEGILQFAMDKSQLLKVSVCLNYRQKHLIYTVDRFKISSLQITIYIYILHKTCKNYLIYYTQLSARHILTMLKELADCSSRPTRPLSLKYFPVHTPSSSGETTSSETALSSSTLHVTYWNATQPMGR